jgi:triosephosphate isomerase (TIM)
MVIFGSLCYRASTKLLEDRMALRKLIAGNWKMNGNRDALAELDGIAKAASANPGVDVAICPPATLIGLAKTRQPNLLIGGQDCHWSANGAHTGCLSVSMLVEAGAEMVIVGHSERRTDNHETSAEVCQKAQAAIAGGLIAIVCVGETEAERDAGQAVSVVTGQISASVPKGVTGSNLVVAYEPVWAIGTGRTPSLDDVAEMHAAIRAQLTADLGEEGAKLRILYGGSVKPSNATELLHVQDVDGALVGGASLTAADFGGIIAVG